MFTYNLVAALLTPFIMPAGFLAMCFKKKYTRQLPLKMGRLPDLSNLRGRRPVIWTHALSVGEVNAVMPLVHRVMKKWPDAGIVCSASTSTGMAALDRKLTSFRGVITSIPLDLPPVTSRVINAISPDCFLLAETDIWPGFIWTLKNRGIPALLINGSISSRAAARLSLMKKNGIDAAGLLYGGFHTMAMQSQHDLNRLTDAAGEDLSQVTCGGNLKFDINIPPVEERRRASLMDIMSIRDDDFVLVAGSTHPDEEKILLECFKAVARQRAVPRCRFIIAPRDPDRAGEIHAIACSMALRSCMRSKGCTGDQDVIILDTLGELAEIYALGHVAFVGGSLVPTGGHNLFEPAVHGIPVLWGPFTESCSDMAEILESGGGGCMVDSPGALKKVITDLASRDESWRRMGENAAEIVRKHGGAVDRYMALLETALQERGFNTQTGHALH